MLNSWKRAAVLALASAAPLAAQQPFDTVWETAGGRIVLGFHDSVLESLGLEVLEIETTGDPLVEGELAMADDGLYSFLIGDASLRFVTQKSPAGDDILLQYGIADGALGAIGGFLLASPSTGAQVNFFDFDLRPFPVVNDGFGPESDPDYLHISTAADPWGGDLELCYVKELFGPGKGYDDGIGDQDPPPVLTLAAFDVVVSGTLARKLGRPDVEGAFIGYGKVEADAWQDPTPHDIEFFRGQNPWYPSPIPEGADDEPSEVADGGGGGGVQFDVVLDKLTSLTNFGRVGAYPNGRIGLMASTTSCNDGNVAIPWLSPGDFVGDSMSEDHPGIAQQIYRLSTDGNGIERFEQIGTGWVKHGFAALAEPFTFCAPCNDDPGFGQLSVGCGDTYGASTNADRFWLGPRNEWDAFTGLWECQGSFFDGASANCVRNEDGGGFGPVDHRIDVSDVDIDVPGASFVLEAMYLVRDEVTKFNNIGWRPVTFTLNGAQNNWNVSTPGASNAQTFGPAILDWGEMQTQADLLPDDGRAVVAVQTTDLGGGDWRYEYAVFNWDLGRNVGSFAVPDVGSPRDFYFHDIDFDGSNDWTMTSGGGLITWTFTGSEPTGTPPSKYAGAIEFGELYNFGFTASAPPGSGDVVVGAFADGPGADTATATTIVPTGDGPWTDLGSGLAGTGGLVPGLSGTGPLTAGSSNSLDLVDALGTANTTLVVGASTVSLPFKGGTMVPSVDFIVPLGDTDGAGTISLPFTWPNGVPASTNVFFQAWINDAGGPAGFSASNGLQATAQ